MDWSEVRAEASPDFTPYHNGSIADPTTDSSGRNYAPRIEERTVIAWDMEGMNLSGNDKPQHPVVFGCSAEIENVIIARRIPSMMMLEHIVAVGKRNPYAIHVGYGFRYDVNMMIQDFSQESITELYKNGALKFKHDGRSWRLRWVPGKFFTVTLYGEKKNRNVSVTIHDFSSFFARPFIDAAEELLRDELSAADYDTVRHGKAERGANLWGDLASVRHYWEREILLMERTFAAFRDVMCRAGFPLKDWYGPGALANHIIASRGMRPEMAGAQTLSGLVPLPVHEAVKRAFFGGRFELFRAGRSVGPVRIVDINSAYPDALRRIPSLADGSGEWVHIVSPKRVERFGFYRVTYVAPGSTLYETRPMPLPWRDERGMITFPPSVTGWYASPEAKMMLGVKGATVHEGWYWRSYGEETFPWTFLAEMYDTRMRLGKKNLLSMPFKLGPNSIYGKLAQTVGWNKEKNLPPKSHALPIAAWITSYCRAKLYTAMRRAPGQIIAVETDSIITTASVDQLGITLGPELGQWEADEYDEIVYLQSGMYQLRRDGEWYKTKSRGLHATEFTPEMAEEYLRGCLPDESGSFPALHLRTKPRFIGAGAANAAKGDFKDHHCVWREQERELVLGKAGKRRHVAALCKACREGLTPWDAPHELVVFSPSDGVTLSAKRRLPWEQKHTDEIEEIREQLEIQADQMGRNA